MKVCYEICIDCGDFELSESEISGLNHEAIADLIMDRILGEVTGEVSWWIE